MDRLDGVTVAVTGIGGFIGQRVALLAQSRGARVQGLELDPGAAQRARSAGLDVVVGSVTRVDDALQAVRGAQVVLHTAALLDEGGAMAAARAVNVQGTLTVAEAAARAGAELLVHLSSVMVYGFTFPDGVDESGPLRAENNPYCQTKIEAEAALSARARLPVAIVRPGDVYGPGSVPWVLRPLGLARRAPLVVPSRHAVFNHVHVDNLAEALLRVAARRLGGHTLNVTDGGGVSFLEWFDRLASWQGRRAVPVPPTVARALFLAVAAGHRAAGLPAPVDPHAVDFLLRPYRYSTARALALLGDYRTVSFDEGVVATEAWCRARGLCRP